MVRVRHSPGITGSFEADGFGPYAIDEGIMDIDDEAAALHLVDAYDHLSWEDEPPDIDANPRGGADTSGSTDGAEPDTQPGETIVCGYYDEDEMDHPCQRDAGWGTDESTGYCRPHREQAAADED